MMAKTLVGISLVQVAAVAYDIKSLYTSQQSGDGTYFDMPDIGTGNCAYRSTTGLNQFAQQIQPVAINSVQYDSSAACGVCLTMQGTGSGSGSDPISTEPFTAVVVDQCPSCPSLGDLDLATNPALDGRWDITWTAIPCPVGDEFFQYMLEGSNQNYVKIQVRNTMFPVSTFELINPSTNAYQELVRSNDNFFVASGGWDFGSISVTLQARLTSIYGEVVEDQVAMDLSSTTPVSGSAQFTDSSSSSIGNSNSSGEGSDSDDATRATPFIVVLAVMMAYLQ